MRRSRVYLLAVVLVVIAGVVVAKQATKARQKPTNRSGSAGNVLPGSALPDSLKSGRPTLAEFGLGTCEVCKAMAPLLDQAAARYRGRANIVFVDLGAYQALGRAQLSGLLADAGYDVPADWS